VSHSKVGYCPYFKKIGVEMINASDLIVEKPEDLLKGLMQQVLNHEFELSPKLIQLAEEVEEEIQSQEARIRLIVTLNQLRVLQAFREAGISEYHLKETTGYGYGDIGREGLDQIFARVFGAEAGLVRLQMVSGTHALAVALFGNLRAGDELISVTGAPYDTLAEIIGISQGPPPPGSLSELGVIYREIPLKKGRPDLEAVNRTIGPRTRMALIQRSSGYSWRPGLTIRQIKELIDTIKSINPNTLVLVDNCYGEFVEEQEPGMVGSDLTVGSLIKNPGGGLAPSGGYIVGRQDCVQAAARRLTAPGIGMHVGATLGVNRWFYQGLFMAPQIVGQALRGALFASRLFQRLGYEVQPQPSDIRGDIIQAIKLNTPEALESFCRVIQQYSPIDSTATPVFDELPGYDHQVIMAAGTFVQGASLELSADAPLSSPYIAFLQGGLSFDHTRIATLCAAQALLNESISL
jgi:cystathionine beta-lyase family protein involved in aluminum resistance